ncbi:MAG: two-component system, NtrC family, sensor kinase [Thermodesulfobacteriota bacterium]|nr:two-component system, NtrC family, sensor kinase [Thermodesulfobacteriota bacterium]
MKFVRDTKSAFGRIVGSPEGIEGAKRYELIRRNISILMLLITIVPLLLMALINYLQYQSALRNEILEPMKVLVNKAKNSLELFLTSRVSILRFIASAYKYDELADEKNLKRIFRVLRQEFEGFIDLGLIDGNGVQVSYSGPYNLRGQDYSGEAWFDQVRVNGMYVSDVFLGFRKLPHIVIAVQHSDGESDSSWIVRATIDTKRFDQIITNMGIQPECDAFIINRSGVLQTESKFYGQVLEKRPDLIFPLSYEAAVTERVDSRDQPVVTAYSYSNRSDFVLMFVKPKATVLKAWYTLKSELILVLLVGVIVIVITVMRLTAVMVNRMRTSDERRELAFREMQHTHKLSSIGRLAAGVAHEVNNPMAIVNEKAGLMKDLIELNPDFPQREKFLSLITAITQAVDRCRTITHRLLGFARRMDVEIQLLDVNDIVKETMSFLEKEALHRNIRLTMHLAQDLPRISSDRGQLQQVFLNIVNNAFAAVSDGGLVSVTTWDHDKDNIGVSIQDDGTGMSDDTLKHIYEPFFTTKKGRGTGLGLSITYGIVKKLGGDIDVQSKLGKGTRFIVYLPKRHEVGREEQDG